MDYNILERFIEVNYEINNSLFVEKFDVNLKFEKFIAIVEITHNVNINDYDVFYLGFKLGNKFYKNTMKNIIRIDFNPMFYFYRIEKPQIIKSKISNCLDSMLKSNNITNVVPNISYDSKTLTNKNQFDEISIINTNINNNIENNKEQITKTTNMFTDKNFKKNSVVIINITINETKDNKQKLIDFLDSKYKGNYEIKDNLNNKLSTISNNNKGSKNSLKKIEEGKSLLIKSSNISNTKNLNNLNSKSNLTLVINNINTSYMILKDLNKYKKDNLLQQCKLSNKNLSNISSVISNITFKIENLNYLSKSNLNSYKDTQFFKNLNSIQKSYINKVKSLNSLPKHLISLQSPLRSKPQVKFLEGNIIALENSSTIDVKKSYTKRSYKLKNNLNYEDRMEYLQNLNTPYLTTSEPYFDINELKREINREKNTKIISNKFFNCIYTTRNNMINKQIISTPALSKSPIPISKQVKDKYYQVLSSRRFFSSQKKIFKSNKHTLEPIIDNKNSNENTILNTIRKNKNSENFNNLSSCNSSKTKIINK